MDDSTGALQLENIVRDQLNPSFLALDPQRRRLYACNEIGNYENRPTGSISSFRIEPNGNLTFLNRQPTEGRNPAHVSVDPTGRFVLAANYTGGNVSVLPIRSDGSVDPPSHVVDHRGTLGPNTARQEAPHAHMILPDLYGRFVLANDLGIDQTLVYRLDLGGGRLVPADTPFAPSVAGGGPRHLAFHQTGRWVYVLNELTSSITVFRYDAESGRLTSLQTISTLPANYVGVNTTAQILVAPGGRFVYASNRGHDSIATFAVDLATGMLTFVERVWSLGETPRNFNIDPSGNFMHVAHQNTDNIMTFRIDRQTGKIAFAGPFTFAGQPVCIVYLTAPDPGNAARDGVTFTAAPGPVTSFDGSGSGWTTLSWNAPGASDLEIRIGTPNGVFMGRHPTYGSTTTGNWVSDGTTFYLQDVTGGKSLTAENTLGSVRVRVSR